MQKTRISLSKIIVIVVTLAAAGMQPACRSEPPPVEDAATRELVKSGEILFRVKVSDMGIQTGSLAQGKSPNDYVEVSLPGEMYNPPKKVASLQGRRPSGTLRSTPLNRISRPPWPTRKNGSWKTFFPKIANRFVNSWKIRPSGNETSGGKSLRHQRHRQAS